MVYLLRMVIFHGYVSHNQRVTDFGSTGGWFCDDFCATDFRKNPSWKKGEETNLPLIFSWEWGIFHGYVRLRAKMEVRRFRKECIGRIGTLLWWTILFYFVWSLPVYIDVPNSRCFGRGKLMANLAGKWPPTFPHCRAVSKIEIGTLR